MIFYICSGAYLYRKERKKRKRAISSSNPIEIKVSRPSTEDASSCCSTNAGAPEEPEVIEGNF